MKAAGVVAVAVLAVGACKAPGHAKEDGTLLAQATKTVAALEGPTMHMPAKKDGAALPEGPVVRLAIARNVPWVKVDEKLVELEKAGKKVSILAGYRHHVKGFELSDELGGKPIKITAYNDGKFCVHPPKPDEPDPAIALGKPKVTEVPCVQGADRKHISRAHVRELVREANKKWGTQDVIVEAHPHLGWADVVRTIDGARTCCRNVEIRVEIRRAAAGS